LPDQDQQQQPQQPENNLNTANAFRKGMNRDLAAYLLSPEQWISAKNMINNSQQGDTSTLLTESANQLCITLPYTLIGAIPLDGAEWMVFTTDNINSEIGIINTDNCTYTTFSNTFCLNFKTTNLITGAARRNYDCGYNVYWSDGGLNPDRYVDTNTTNVNNLIWVQECTTTTSCTTCVNTNQLNCANIQIAPLVNIPCVSLAKSTGAGTLENGTYQIAIAYAVNGIKCTDYLIVSEAQSIFSHNNGGGAIVATITDADIVHFKEMLITIISYNNSQLLAKKLGIFDTTQQTFTIDFIDPTLPTESLSNIPLQTPAVEKSDSIWNVNTYLLRNGLYERPDPNYQPIANQIQTQWVQVRYPEQYYRQTAINGNTGTYFSGNNYSYMGDEQYCFFIRGVYNTGDKTASYHIPGRAFNVGTPSTTWDNNWQSVNTAFLNSGAVSTLPDGGVVVGTGSMGYWQSTELYPSQQSSVWNSNIVGHPEFNLCGTPIRHHKFPDQTIGGINPHFDNFGNIYIFGVQFSNIQPFLDNNGNIITEIIGYEILRGSREGQKSIIAKGIINNMCEYPVPGTGGGTGAPQQFGLFQNYPANDLRADYYLTSNQNLINEGGTNGNTNPLTNQILTNIFSFHSPDTSFQHPFLGSPNLKIYLGLSGTQTGSFVNPWSHPMFKTATNFDSIISDVFGLISAISEVGYLIGGGTYGGVLQGTDSLPWTTTILPPVDFAAFSDATGAGAVFQEIYSLAVAAAAIALGVFQLEVVSEQIYRVIKGLIPARQFAAQFNGHTWYNNYQFVGNDLGTVPVLDYQYIEGGVQTFGNYEVNNLYRNNFVALNLQTSIKSPYWLTDTTRYTISQNGGMSYNSTPSSCYYTGLKVPIASQYGQIGSPREIPIVSCVYPFVFTATTSVQAKSPVIFNGDIYINRYTEKNPMLFFNDWLINVAEDYSYNYRNYINIPYPAYWIDNQQIPSHLISTASNYRRLDNEQTGWSLFSSPFYVDSGNFYLFCNGVRDFYVESDVNIGFRDWDDLPSKRFYDPYGYTDIYTMFRSDLMKSDQFYKYDYSLSINKFYSQYVSFGQTLDIDYDPILAYTCYDYYPRRVAYSLPQNEEQKIDNWRQFLANNYYDFPTPVTSIKSVDKTGAIFMLAEASPVHFTGAQVLQQGENMTTAITIGDGGLFNQPLQNVLNTDKGINYGSSTSKFGVLSCPYGVFWISQEAGKLLQFAPNKTYFNQGETVVDICTHGLKWWFAKYLPSQLMRQFPNYPYSDNPVIGVGCQLSFDETNDILYISKRDYVASSNIYFDGTNFYYLTGCPFGYHLDAEGYCTNNLVTLDTKGVKNIIKLGNTNYFTDCSFTASYDCKNKMWISYHSWNPTFILNTRNHQMTTNAAINNNLYVHNVATNLFANYYGQQFETSIEYPINTDSTTATLRNVEYFLEAYYYQQNGWDRTTLLNYNFDNAIVYNTEQISGMLNLNPQNQNPYLDLNYPDINTSSVDILYFQKEKTTKFNQFWDITLNRQSYTPMWITAPNGIDKQINNAYVDYNKPQVQRKKLRSYGNVVYLRKANAGNIRICIRLAKNKQQKSNR